MKKEITACLVFLSIFVAADFAYAHDGHGHGGRGHEGHGGHGGFFFYFSSPFYYAPYVAGPPVVTYPPGYGYYAVPPPQPLCVWVPGHWEYNGYAQVWVPGHWAYPPPD